MNENDKHEQEQPVTKWPGYAYLVLAFSILFALVILGVGFLQLWGVIDTAGPLQAWLSWCSQCQKAIIITLCLGLAFFAGAFVFLALKATTERSEAAGKAVVWVCRILFYPFHVVVRAVICLVVVLLLLAAIVGAVLLGYCSYIWLGPCLDKLPQSANTFLGASAAGGLILLLPKFVMPTFSKCLEKIEEIIEAVSNLSLFPKMAIKESLETTKEAVEAVDKKATELIVKLALLVLLAPIAGFSITAFDTVLPTKEETPTLPVQEKSSYVFLGNMPWIVGNVQSFFSSAVVFPRDATPDDLEKDGEDALKLNPQDEQFYRAVYKPLLADLTRCGTSDNKVKIELSGFASTSNINSGTPQKEKIRQECSDIEERLKQQDDSDKHPDIKEVFNLCVAERRAESVKVMLESFLDNTEQKHAFDFTVKKWDNLKQMQDQTTKIFCDAPSHTSVISSQDNKDSCPENGQYNSTRGLMNRRVDIAITDTPRCMM